MLQEENPSNPLVCLPMHCPLLTIALVLFLGAPAFGEGARKSANPSPTAMVVDVTEGDTFRIDQAIDGATQVKLVGIQAPRRFFGRLDLVSWPLAGQGRDTLAALILDRGVVLKFMGPRADRHGRLIAQVYRDDGTWIQGEMLKRGMARVLTFADNRALATEMLMLEETARERGLGIWSDPFYAVRTPEEAGKDVGSFQLVEGPVMKAARVKSYVYLNFGEDWRTDFTVSVPVKHLRRFADSGLDLLALSGRVIRVRGWLKEYRGPMIDATHPEQIEVLAPDTAYPGRSSGRGDEKTEFPAAIATGTAAARKK